MDGWLLWHRMLEKMNWIHHAMSVCTYVVVTSKLSTFLLLLAGFILIFRSAIILMPNFSANSFWLFEFYVVDPSSLTCPCASLSEKMTNDQNCKWPNKLFMLIHQTGQIIIRKRAINQNLFEVSRNRSLY